MLSTEADFTIFDLIDPISRSFSIDSSTKGIGGSQDFFKKITLFHGSVEVS